MVASLLCVDSLVFFIYSGYLSTVCESQNRKSLEHLPSCTLEDRLAKAGVGRGRQPL